jgi:hypothetical protein
MFAGPVKLVELPGGSTSWFVFALVFMVAWLSFGVLSARIGGHKGHSQIGFLAGLLTFPVTIAFLMMFLRA